MSFKRLSKAFQRLSKACKGVKKALRPLDSLMDCQGAQSQKEGQDEGTKDRGRGTPLTLLPFTGPPGLPFGSSLGSPELPHSIHFLRRWHHFSVRATTRSRMVDSMVFVRVIKRWMMNAINVSH